jgi:hypothetical protein
MKGRTMSKTEGVDYGAIITDLEAKKAALEQTIASLRSALAIGALGQFGDSAVGTQAFISSASGGEVPVGAFLGRSIPDAAKLCLQILKRKMTSREIAEALKKGGIESTAKNFPTIVHSILDRASKGTSGIVKLDRSFWGLAEWYPLSMRSSVAAERRSTKAKKGRKGRTTKNADGKVATVERVPAGGTQERLIRYLRAKPAVEFSPQEIADALDMRVQTVHFLLGKLAHSKAAQKTTEGKYRAIVA